MAECNALQLLKQWLASFPHAAKPEAKPLEDGKEIPSILKDVQIL
jgi:hypothetical protein